jgi:hypothetical protein
LHWPELAESDQVRNGLAIVVVERVVPDEAGHQRSSEVIRGHQALLVPDEAGHQRLSEECAGAVGGAGAV